MRNFYKLLIVLAVVLLVFAMYAYFTEASTPATPTYYLGPPANAHYVPDPALPSGGYCIGSYSDDVSVSWPSVNGTC